MWINIIDDWKFWRKNRSVSYLYSCTEIGPWLRFPIPKPGVGPTLVNTHYTACCNCYPLSRGFRPQSFFHNLCLLLFFCIWNPTCVSKKCDLFKWKAFSQKRWKDTFHSLRNVICDILSFSTMGYFHLVNILLRLL